LQFDIMMHKHGCVEALDAFAKRYYCSSAAPSSAKSLNNHELRLGGVTAT
jgi:hypothetical protein